MEKVNIIDTGIEWDEDDLAERDETDMIVIHHTGSPDMDASAEQIHEWHLSNGWAGIGYHFVVRKNGTIERGRPQWAKGAHAEGDNSHSIGIHLSGNFSAVKPTTKQIENTALLIANLCEEYGIPIDREHIVGHGELMATDCPGTYLQALLDDGTLTGKANYYRYGSPEEQKETAWEEDMKAIQTEITEKEMRENRYKALEELPDWAKPTIKKLIDKKLLGGDGASLDLSLDMVRVFVINDRAGLYG